MAKGIKIIEGDARNPVADDKYRVNGIAEIITQDETGNPFFKLYGSDLKVGVKFSTVNGEEGPVMFCLPAEYVALVQLLGATTFLPSKATRTNSAVILDGMNKANEAGHEIYVTSKDGYVNAYQVDGLHPPEGQYKVIFKEAFSPKFRDSLEFTPGANNGEYIIFKFQVVGNTVWEGSVFSIFMHNNFVASRDVNGKSYVAKELGHPLLAPGKNSERWQYFGAYFVPGIWDNYDWQIEPSKSEWGICEVQKPQYVLINKALAVGQEVNVWYQKREKSKDYWFDMLDLRKFNQLSEDRTAEIADFLTYVKSKVWYQEDAETEYDNDTLFESESPLQWSETGKEWAKQYLGGETGPWNGAGLNMEDRRFEILSASELGKLMDEMESRYN